MKKNEMRETVSFFKIYLNYLLNMSLYCHSSLEGQHNYAKDCGECFLKIRNSGAVGEDRTLDLTLTKGVHYHCATTARLT